MSLVELPMLAQGSPAGLALAIDELRREEPDRSSLPESIELAAGTAPDPVLGADVGWRFAYPRHIEIIQAEVVEAIARSNARLKAGKWDGPEILLVEVPPRHGKSTLISEFTPAWFLGTFPDRRVILCSCESDFAQTWGAKARDILEEFGHQLFGVRVSQRSSAAKRWDIDNHRGGMITAGVGGRITGSGAHLMIIDDPTKNAEEALSERIQEKHADWWHTTARTRIEPGGVVVILMTRWHERDLGGLVKQLAEDDGDPVREIRLPALAEENDPLGRNPGEALWPERYSAEALAKTRKTIGPYWFSAMYQGSPTPDDGGIFNRRWFRYFTLEAGTVKLYDKSELIAQWPANQCTKVSYADLAESEKKTADYTVLTEAWVTPDRDLLIMNVTRDRIPGPDQPDFFKNHMVGKLKVEAIGYQSSLMKALRRQGLPVDPVYPDKDKVTRASAAGALYKGGKIYHRRGADYLADFEAELLAFPAGAHDDQVDTVAYAARDLPNVPVSRARRKRIRGKGGTVAGGIASANM